MDKPHEEMPHLKLTYGAIDGLAAVKLPTPVSVLRAVERSLLVWGTRAEHGREPNLGAPALPIREIPAWPDYDERRHRTVCPPRSQRGWARHPSYKTAD